MLIIQLLACIERTRLNWRAHTELCYRIDDIFARTRHNFKLTAQKMKFSFKDYRISSVNVTFTEEILNGKLHFLCSDRSAWSNSTAVKSASLQTVGSKNMGGKLSSRKTNDGTLLQAKLSRIEQNRIVSICKNMFIQLSMQLATCTYHYCYSL